MALREALAASGRVSLAEDVTHALLSAASLSTEFLGESRVTLKKILRESSDQLTSDERARMWDVVKQLDETFRAHFKSKVT